MTDKKQIDSVFNYIFNEVDDLTTDAILNELAKVQPQLYHEYRKMTGVRYIKDRLSFIKKELSYISDRWTTPDRISFILTAINERVY